MPFARTASALLAIAALALPQLSRAQELPAEPAPAHLALLDGEGTLLREGERDQVTPGMPLIPGDVLRIDRGRANVLFPDGSALDLDEFTTVEFLSPTHLRLTEGRVILQVVGVLNPSEAQPFAVDTPAATAETQGPGEYQVSVLPSTAGQQTELAVIRGNALLITERGQTPLRAAQHSFAFVNGLPTYPQSFNSGRTDAFEQWSAALRAERMGSASARYLPPDLRTYGGVFDRNGSWGYDGSYGNVWYPTVDPGWQPYVDGYWSPLPAYGWTWIGFGAWSWPTHHYGRWGYARSRWFWIPGRQWGPAWVSWGSAPGYVSWSPLGFNNQPVFALSVFTGRSAFGWTVVSRDRFVGPGGGWRGGWGGSGRGQRIVSVNPPARTAFVTHDAAPLPAPRTTPRRAEAMPRARTNASSAAVAGGGYAAPRTGGGRTTAPGGRNAGAPPVIASPSGNAGRRSDGVPRVSDGTPSARPRDRARYSQPATAAPGADNRTGSVRAVPRSAREAGGSQTAPLAPRVAPAPAAPQAPLAPPAPTSQGRPSQRRVDGPRTVAPPPTPNPSADSARGSARRARPAEAAPAPAPSSGASQTRERAMPRASSRPPQQDRGQAQRPSRSSGGERARGDARRAR